MAIILEGKAISSILKDFLTWHVLPIQINNRSSDFNKGEHDVGHDRAHIKRNTSRRNGKYLKR